MVHDLVSPEKNVNRNNPKSSTTHSTATLELDESIGHHNSVTSSNKT